MIFHQHVAVNVSILNMLRLGENLQEMMSVLINFENGPFLITAMGNMIDSTWILTPYRSIYNNRAVCETV